MTDLDGRLRELYAKQQPAAEFSETLLAVSDVVASEPPAPMVEKVFAHWRRSALIKFASAGVALVAVMLLSVGLHERGSLVERNKRVVQEIAMTHTTRLELEYHENDLDVLNEQMAQLSFPLSVPAGIEQNHVLVGSRYCTLAGHLAAQLKFKDVESGEFVSVFVTQADEDLESMSGKSSSVAGLDVAFWEENGLFFAKAQR